MMSAYRLKHVCYISGLFKFFLQLQNLGVAAIKLQISNLLKQVTY